MKTTKSISITQDDGAKLMHFKVGQRVYWEDPDEGIANGEANVIKVNGDVVSIRFDGGTDAEVLACELINVNPAPYTPK